MSAVTIRASMSSRLIDPPSWHQYRSACGRRRARADPGSSGAAPGQFWTVPGKRMRLGVPLSPSLISVTRLPLGWLTTDARFFWADSEYRDGVDRNSWPLGIRPADLATVAVVIAVIELNVTVGGGAGLRRGAGGLPGLGD